MFKSHLASCPRACQGSIDPSQFVFRSHAVQAETFMQKPKPGQPKAHLGLRLIARWLGQPCRPSGRHFGFLLGAAEVKGWLPALHF